MSSTSQAAACCLKVGSIGVRQDKSSHLESVQHSFAVQCLHQVHKTVRLLLWREPHAAGHVLSPLAFVRPHSRCTVRGARAHLLQYIYILVAAAEAAAWRHTNETNSDDKCRALQSHNLGNHWPIGRRLQLNRQCASIVQSSSLCVTEIGMMVILRQTDWRELNEGRDAIC